MSLYRDGTIKQGRIRGSLRAIILDPVVVVGVYIYMYSLGKGISRSARVSLCEGACNNQARLHRRADECKSHWRRSVSEICSPTGDRSQRGTRERGRVGDGEIDGGRKTERNRSISLFCLLTGIPSTRTSDRANGRVVGRGEGSEERRED